MRWTPTNAERAVVGGWACLIGALCVGQAVARDDQGGVWFGLMFATALVGTWVAFFLRPFIELDGDVLRVRNAFGRTREFKRGDFASARVELTGIALLSSNYKRVGVATAVTQTQRVPWSKKPSRADPVAGAINAWADGA